MIINKGLLSSFLSQRSKERKSWRFPFDMETRFGRMARRETLPLEFRIKISEPWTKERGGTAELFGDSPKRTSGIFLSSRSDGGGGGGDSFWPGKNGGHVRRIFGWIFDPPFVAHRETIANLSPISLSSFYSISTTCDDASNLLRRLEIDELY